MGRKTANEIACWRQVDASKRANSILKGCTKLGRHRTTMHGLHHQQNQKPPGGLGLVGWSCIRRVRKGGAPLSVHAIKPCGLVMNFAPGGTSLARSRALARYALYSSRALL